MKDGQISRQRLDRISAWVHRLTFRVLVILGGVVVFALLYSTVAGGVSQALRQFDGDRLDLLTYSENTSLLFLLSILIQIAFFFWGTMYVRRPSNFAKIALVLPFATGTIAPAAALYTLASSQIGPLHMDWFIDSTAGARLFVSLVDAWQWTGVFLFLGFAYTERIPSSHFDQARLEGISRYGQWRLIVWPALRRVAVLYVAFKALDWVRKFDFIRIDFGDGGPGQSVETFAMFAAKRYFDAGTEGYASLLALVQVLILMVCVVGAYRRSAVIGDIGRMGPSASRKRRSSYGAVAFWAVLGSMLVAPLLWFLVMSLQPSDVIFLGGFKFWPHSLSTTNFSQLANSPKWTHDFLWSVFFYGSVTACAVLLALNEAYQLIANVRPEYERRDFAAIIGIFFLPGFAVFSAVGLLSRWASLDIDPYAHFVISTISGYALGFAVVYTAFKFGFRHRYEQLVLEFGSPALAFWSGIVWPQIWVVCVATVLVFAASWNEPFLSDMWTSASGWRPFAVEIGTAIQEYRMEYGLLAAGAVISMLTPVMLGGTLYGVVRIVKVCTGNWEKSAIGKACGNG